jgi:hypothetical protein
VNIIKDIELESPHPLTLPGEYAGNGIVSRRMVGTFYPPHISIFLSDTSEEPISFSPCEFIHDSNILIKKTSQISYT